MLAVARAVAPDVDWREGDAASLPLRDNEQFDVVVCQQGLQFVADKAAAARQMRRALAPGGRLAIGTWRPNDEIPMIRDLHRIAERHLGTIADARHSFGETTPLEALLRDAGFKDVNVRTMTRTIRFADGTVFLRLNTTALVGMSAASKGMSDEQRGQAAAAIITDSAGVLTPYTDPTGLAFEISSNIALARG
jgi:SAM-dependent methyltransferase